MLEVIRHTSQYINGFNRESTELFYGVPIYGRSEPNGKTMNAPAHIRSTSIALGYNLTLGIVGGLTPLTATWLVHQTHSAVAPAFLIIAAALISFGTILSMKETYKQKL